MDAERRSTVAVATGKDRVEATVRAFDLLGGIKKWVKPGYKVLLKPNIMSYGGTPMVTHIDMIKVMAMLCREAGAVEVAVGENSVCGLPPKRQMEYLGYDDALKRLGVKFIPFDEDEWVYVKAPEAVCLKDMHLPRSLVEADVWITLPVAKTHIATLSTLGIKNSHGILPDEDKARHHRHKPLQGSSLWYKFIDILQVARPHLSVMDMWHAMDQQGPALGFDVYMGLVLAGEDVVAGDAVTDYLMGYDNLEAPLPRLAQERGLGVADLKRIDVLGESLEAHRKKFIRPRSGDDPDHEAPGLIVLRGDLCKAGCGMPMSYIVDTFRKVMHHDVADLGPMYILCGYNPPAPPEKRFIMVFGDCAIYSTWNYEYRRKPSYIGPWWRPKPGYVDVPGCCPLGLSWIKDFGKLMTGYSPVLTLCNAIEFIEANQYTLGEGVPLYKNPRRWHWDPQFKERFAKEIAASNPPEYIYAANESMKGERGGEK